MASISLRAYNSEIETMIEHEQAEEAVAHCMHILQSVPKHIATYRLLGKALLEIHRFTDATDIFNRVLSSVPDDFVSHVGMSIIRENENNLDGAIWHMERAYEAQPANAAIQDELRRLYGRRDGMAPPKIRLTRGALARMYAKGQLYQQAIGELQAAISEDDRRPDLQVQLALMYYQSGQREQAIRICSDLLKKLPYCLEANRILADLLPESTSSGAQSYHQRLISLDPYYSHTKPGASSSDRVPANAVVFERMEYEPGKSLPSGEAAQPDWAVSLGTPLQAAQVEALPEWASAESMDETVVTAPQEEEKIPDFLKEAGWTESERSADEIAMEELQKDQENLASEAIEPAEIPDWLLEIAPEEGLEAGQSVEVDQNQSAPDEEILPWLQDAEPGPTDSVVTWLQETKDTVTEQEIKDLESALQEASTKVEGLDTSWLAGEEVSEIQETAAIEEESQPDMTTMEEPLPDWLAAQEKSTGVGTELEAELEAAQESPVDLPDWLQELEIESTAEVDELPDWLKEPQDQLAESEAAVSLEEPLSSEEISLEQAPEGEATVIWQEPLDLAQPEPEAPSDETWFMEEEEIGAAAGIASAAEPALDSLAETDDITKWLESLDEADAEAGLEAAIELPEWLEEEKEAVNPLDDTQPMRIIPEEIESAPVEAGESYLETEAEAALFHETAETAAPVEFNLDDPDAALAWLESLAAQQGAAADQLTTRPEERPETPDWILQSAAEAEARGEIPTYEPTETVEGFEESVLGPEEVLAEEAAELPEIEPALDAAEATVITEAPFVEEPVVEDLGVEEFALEGLLAEQLEGEEPAVEELFIEQAITGEPAFEEPAVQEPAAEELVVEEIAFEEPVVEEAELEMLEEELVEELPVQAEELPEWLLESIEAPEDVLSEATAATFEVEEELEAEAGLPDWLQEEEVEKVLGDTQPTKISLEAEIKPEWMLETESGSEGALEEAPPEEVEIPAWLREVAEEPGEPAAEAIVSDLSIEKIDLNTASLSTLEKLPGIGFILAQSIINHREANGPFDRIEDLQEIPGIGSYQIEELHDLVEVKPGLAPIVAEELVPESLLEDEEILMTARQALLNGEFTHAVGISTKLVQQNLFIDEIIQDLQDALYRNSSEAVLWEALGDAYVRKDQLQEALDAYLHAEELLS